jgi:hypothetical protein
MHRHARARAIPLLGLLLCCGCLPPPPADPRPAPEEDPTPPVPPPAVPATRPSSLTEAAVLTCPDSWVRSLAFSGDGKLLAAVSGEADRARQTRS